MCVFWVPALIFCDSEARVNKAEMERQECLAPTEQRPWARDPLSQGSRQQHVFFEKTLSENALLVAKP